MDAIESGIVKLTRVPMIDNVPGGDGPKFRDLWEEIKKGPVQLPKKGRSGHGALNPQMLPPIVVMACDDDVLPDPVSLAAIGESADLEPAYETERHLLRVAATRARDRLMVSGVAPGSAFPDDLAP